MELLKYKIKFPTAKLFSEGLLEEQKDKRENRLKEKYGKDNSWRTPSLENFIKKYGEDEGTKRYNEYCKKLKGKGSLQYYLEKYGENEGTKRYNEMCQKKSECHKKEWYLNKFGIIEGIKIFNELSKKKSTSLENYIKKYGKEKGTKKYKNCFDKQIKHQSKIAIELFNSIKNIFKNEKMYFYDNPKEFGRYLKSIKRYCFLDFYMPDKNKVIEFYR